MQQTTCSIHHAEPLQPVSLPETGCPTIEFCRQLESSLDRATWAGVDATKQVLPPHLLQSIVLEAGKILEKEPTLLEIHPASLQQNVTVVGDTHGQYHDVCRLFDRFGHPSVDRIFIFNGDYVDRGAWGVETLALLLAWKWALPNHVYLLRGNHETNTITRIYGFYAELKAKYGAESKGLFVHIRRMFAHLPLAAVVQKATLILHGGLFRAPPKKHKGSKRRRSSGVQALTVGTLEDLRRASKGGQDPDPERSSKNTIASDVVWSDPVNAPGLRANDARGCGTVYGPDVTQSFLAANGLQLIIRSHEGPDARDRRLEEDRMPSVDSGYAVDHDGPNGKLVTLFSAPDYPQFMAEGEERYHNKGAVITLSAPDYATPAVASFEAVLPRPPAESYYDVPGWSDEDDELTQREEAEQTTQDGKDNKAADGAVTKGEPAGSAWQIQQVSDAMQPSASTVAVATGSFSGKLAEQQRLAAATVPHGLPDKDASVHILMLCEANRAHQQQQVPGCCSSLQDVTAAAVPADMQSQQQQHVAAASALLSSSATGVLDVAAGKSASRMQAQQQEQQQGQSQHMTTQHSMETAPSALAKAGVDSGTAGVCTLCNGTASAEDCSTVADVDVRPAKRHKTEEPTTNRRSDN